MFISVIIPCHNEELSLNHLLAELDKVFISKSSNNKFSYILIDDGSVDKTWSCILDAQATSDRVCGVRLSRNFGHQKALLAGLELCLSFADYIVTMDADLQHPPRVANEMLKLAISKGYDVVSAQRDVDSRESVFKALTSKLFYKLLAFLGSSIPPRVSDFRVLSRRAAAALVDNKDLVFFPRGLVSQIGFNQILYPYRVAQRYAGVSAYSWRRMLRLAADGISSSSIMPLRFAFFLSLLLLSVCGVMILYILSVWLSGRAIPGWVSIVLPIYVFFGINFLILGIIGEYVGKTFAQTLGRPRYVICEIVGLNR